MNTTEIQLIRQTVEANKIYVDKELDTIREKIDSKVPFKFFTWIVGTMIIILMAIMAFIINLELDTNKEVSLIDKTVSQLQGKLDPYTIKYPNQ